MDKIGNYLSCIGGKLISTAKEETTTRITFFQKGNYAFMNYYVSTPDGIPAIQGSQSNSYMYFVSRSQCDVIVDWGDGNVETFEMQYNGTNYIAGWRSLNIDYHKYPDSVGGGWGFGINQETKEYIRPYPNHHYVDEDKEKERHIKMTFSSPDVISFNTNTIAMWGFPIIELPNLEALSISYTLHIPEIPFSRLSKLKKLKQLGFSSLGVRLEVIPETIFTMTNLTFLNMSNIFNLSDPQASNLRKISNLKNLTTLNLTLCHVQTYIKEFNDLPKLANLYITDASSNQDNTPLFDEIDEINPSIKYFSVLDAGYSGSGRRTSWMNEIISGKGLEHVNSYPVNFQSKISIEPPEYLKEMHSLDYMSMGCTFNTQERIDGWINNFYNYVTSWNEITMTNTLKNGKRNQFYGLSMVVYSSQYSQYEFRPSGQYQAPDGFIVDVDNGTPKSPLEKVYVLEKNYKQRWTIKPE